MTDQISDERLIADVTNLVRAAWNLCDGTANENPPDVDQSDWDRLSAALDRLDALVPPAGVIAGPGAKVEHALTELRALRNSTGAVKVPSRDALAEIISKAGAPPGPPDGPIGALPVTHFLRVQAYKQADAILAALTEAE